MSTINSTRIIFFLSLFSAPQSVRASLLPTSWTLNTSVATFGPNGDTQGAFFTSVQRSFHNQHSVTFAGSTVSTQYDIEIMQNIAQYNIQTQMTCASVNHDGPLCGASGRIIMTPATDVLVQAAGANNYVFMTDAMDASFSFRVLRTSPLSLLFGNGGSDNSDLSGPHAGVLNISSSGIIPAGTPVWIEYSFRSHISTLSPDAVLPSSGNIQITMTAVPEPSAMALLSPAVLMLVRRRR